MGTFFFLFFSENSTKFASYFENFGQIFNTTKLKEKKKKKKEENPTKQLIELLGFFL